MLGGGTYQIQHDKHDSSQLHALQYSRTVCPSSCTFPPCLLPGISRTLYCYIPTLIPRAALPTAATDTQPGRNSETKLHPHKGRVGCGAHMGREQKGDNIGVHVRSGKGGGQGVHCCHS